jgi:quercetin dioxygenase-like cupin family protein
MAGLVTTRFAEARAYEAPNHRLVRSLRLQGFEPGGPENYWVGLSHFLPGGGAGPDASPLEKTYIVLAGALTILVDDRETILHAFDSCTVGPDTIREIINRGNDVVTMLVVMPYPKAAP